MIIFLMLVLALIQVLTDSVLFIKPKRYVNTCLKRSNDKYN